MNRTILGLATELQKLVEIICKGERDVTVEDCDGAKRELELVTGKDWDDEL